MEKLKTITRSAAVDLFIKGQPIRDGHITGNFEIYKFEKECDGQLVIENCIVDNMVAAGMEFKGPVRLINCRFYRCSFDYAYFLKGLTIDNCVFETYLGFDAGGHNEMPNPFRIVNSQFRGFVNFFDCWFKSDVIIMNNEFAAGTNLLGNKDEPFRVQFDVEPRIENNKGRIDLDGEGDRIVNTIILV